MTTNTSSQVKKITEVWASWLSSLALCYAKRLLRVSRYDTLLVCRSNCEKISEVQGAQGGPVTPVAFCCLHTLVMSFDSVLESITSNYIGGEEFPWQEAHYTGTIWYNIYIYLLLFPCHDSLTLLEWSPLKPAALVGLIVIHHRDPHDRSPMANRLRISLHSLDLLELFEFHGSFGRWAQHVGPDSQIHWW